LLSPQPELKTPAHLKESLASQPHLKLHLNTTLREVLGAEHVEGVRVAPRGDAEQVLPVTGMFVYLQGGKPITDFLQGQLPTSSTGCLMVDREFQTTIPGVYAAGDVLCQHVKQVVVSAAEGAVAAMAAEKQLRDLRQITVDWAK
jgi:thioredoxin reductase (NADPH)